MKKDRPLGEGSDLLMMFLVIFIVTIIAGSFFRSWVLFIASIGSLSVAALSLQDLPPSELSIRVKSSRSDYRVYEEDEIWIEKVIQNQGERLEFVEIMDQLPKEVEVVEGNNHTVMRLDGGEKKKLRYKIRCPKRGEYYIGKTKARYRGKLGFFSKEVVKKHRVELRVLPKIEDMRRIKIRPSYTKRDLGNIPSSNIGIGTEFYSLREYVPGDEMRRINWKATARSQNPVSNEYEGEKSGDVILIVDGYKEGNVGTMRENTMKASVRACASIASCTLEDRNRVGLIVLGDYLKWVYPGSGREQFYKIMDGLSKFRSGGLWEFKDITWLIRRFFPGRSLIIFISPLLQEKVSETIIDIAMKEYDVMVISPDPVKIERKLELGGSELSYKMSDIERGILLDKLWDYSMVVDWDPYEPLQNNLGTVIRFWKRR